MSIVVKNLSKIYGQQKALDNISFEAGKNEIIGLIGPNGAGKTTTIKILTAFMPASSGSAFVNGLNINENALEVKSMIGYLPEHNPLYPEMYIKEYLEFVCAIHNIKDAAKRVNEVIELVGLGEEKHKKIKEISKGYKQRVGIAQALIHDPEILILDEPISGLDPNQLIEIRSLIKSLKKNKTIIFSSHILKEVESVCDRVLILNNGKLVSSDALDNLQEGSSSQQLIHIETTHEISRDDLKSLPGFTELRSLSPTEHLISCSKDQDVRAMIFDIIVEKGNRILSMNVRQESLEEVFKSLTKVDDK